MTKVLLQYGSPAPDGTYPPVEGVLIWTPTRRRVIAGMPDKIIMPVGFKVPITGGVITVTVAPSGIDWVWRVDELVKGANRVISYKAVPDQDEVEFTELVSVNPTTLTAIAEPEPIWYPWAEALASTTARAQQNAEDAMNYAKDSVDSAGASAAAAAQSATAAAQSVVQAGGHANYAGTSAFSAGNSAATALGHKNDAEEAEAGAVAARDDALLFKNAAEAAQAYSEDARDISINARTGSESARDQSIALRDEAIAARNATVTSGLVDSNGHLILTRDDLSINDAGYVVGPPINLSITDINTGPAPETIVGPTGPQGPKGDPGGWTTSVIANGTNLDTIITPGLYLNPSANSNMAPGGSSVGGHLEVLASSGYILQRYTNINENREMFSRTRNSAGTWSTWRTFNTARVDQTAGRVMYVWDDLNNRDQLIYGDTGWRDVSGLLLNGATATSANLRRVGANVYLSFNGLKLPSTAVGDPIYSPPVGFVPTTAFGICRETISTGGAYGFMFSATTMLYATIPGGSAANNTTHRFQGTFVSTTTDPWPTTLPGVAFGTIPNL